jgi:drug/metabolite transporter (DMT)-like permease
VAGSGGAVETTPNPALGNSFTIASGVTWAGTLLGLRWLARDGDGADAGAAVMAGNLLAFVVCLPAALPSTGDGGDWPLILGATAFKVLGDARMGGEPTAVEAAARAAPP